MKIRNSALITLGLLGSMTAAQAQFVLLDDFESYTTGSSIGAAANWTTDLAGGADHTVAEASGNKYLSTSLDNNVHSVFNNGSTLLAAGATGTYFFRTLIPSGGAHAGAGVGVTDALDAGWNDAAAIFRLGDRVDTRPANADNFYGYDTSTYNNFGDATTDEWYNVWVVLDNSAQTYDVYLQRDGDATWGTQTQVGTGLGYRNTVGSTIESVFLRSALNTTGALFDDLYFDGSGQNLTNAVPEPSAFALLAGLLGLSVAAVRRRS